MVPKDEILSRLWPDVAVAEASLQRLASLARVALGDQALLRTIRGVGYQLAAEVRVEDEHPAAAAREDAPVTSHASQEIRFCQTGWTGRTWRRSPVRGCGRRVSSAPRSSVDRNRLIVLIRG